MNVGFTRSPSICAANARRDIPHASITAREVGERDEKSLTSRPLVGPRHFQGVHPQHVWMVTLMQGSASVPALQVRALVKRYGALTAVNGISFEVQAGEIFGLLGPNGAGKTTTLEIIEGLRKPAAAR